MRTGCYLDRFNRRWTPGSMKAKSPSKKATHVGVQTVLNQACDLDEPHSITDAQGAYTLDASGYDLTRYNIVAVADTDTAKDLDDGGLTHS